MYLPIFKILDIYFLLKIVSSLLFRYSIFKELFFITLTFSVIVMSLVGTNGLEPSTSRLSGVRSNHLSYAPFPFFEQSCSSLSVSAPQWTATTWAMRPSKMDKWWRLRESNPWPPACKAGALPAELNPRILLSKCSFEYLQNWTTFANYKLLFKTRD